MSQIMSSHRSLKQQILGLDMRKNERILKENYRPISILPAISKIYEKPMENQLNAYFENILSKFECGFKSGFSAQALSYIYDRKMVKIFRQ